MLRKLKESHIDLFLENGTRVRLSTDKIASAYAGATAAKNCTLSDGNALTKGWATFKTEYANALNDSIHATNLLGLSTTFETMEAYHPARGTDFLIKEQLEHADNPFWPFFDDD